MPAVLSAGDVACGGSWDVDDGGDESESFDERDDDDDGNAPCRETVLVFVVDCRSTFFCQMALAYTMLEHVRMDAMCD